MFGLGYLLQRVLLNRTIGPDILPPLLVTFGLSILIQNGLLEIFSADSQALQIGELSTASLHLGAGIAVGTFPLLVFLVSLLLTVGISLLFNRTAVGMALRATSDDPDTAGLMGIRANACLCHGDRLVVCSGGGGWGSFGHSHFLYLRRRSRILALCL